MQLLQWLAVCSYKIVSQATGFDAAIYIRSMKRSSNCNDWDSRILGTEFQIVGAEVRKAREPKRRLHRGFESSEVDDKQMHRPMLSHVDIVRYTTTRRDTSTNCN